jgi:chromodomain-helicase-DNA-binding protein 1
VHLVRRADYLLSVLKSKFVDDPAAKRAVENHHRNNKKNGMHADLKSHNSASISASPAPSAHRKAAREPERHRQRTLSHGHRDSVERLHTPKPESRHSHGSRDNEQRDKKHRRPEEHHHRHKSNEHPANGASNDGDQMLHLLFKPVRESLKVIKSATKSNMPDPQARANVLREHLRIIGNFTRTLLDEDTASLESRLW